MRHSPLLLKYLQSYQKNPSSKVFAPLAEAYRRLGMVQEALKVLKKGLPIHPHYLLGHITLAACYYDLGKFALAKQSIEGYVEEQLDNIMLQSLFAAICEQLGEKERALTTYKYLLFLNPKKEEWQKKVSELEKKTVSAQDVIIDSEPQETLPAHLKGKTDSADWQAISWLSEHIEEVQRDQEGWEVKNLGIGKEDSSFSSDVASLPKKNSAPTVSYTLVDLYARQGHFDKALKLLEKIRQQVPDDPESLERLEKLKIDCYNTFDTLFRERCQLFLERIKLGKGASFLSMAA